MYHKKDYPQVLHDYFSQGTARTYSKNATVVSPQDPPTHMFYIKSGAIRIYTNEHGDEFTHVIYAPGEMFPLYLLTEDRNQQVICETLLPTELMSVPLEQFSHDLANDNILATTVLRQTAEQYRVYAMRVANLEYKYASERLAYRLILLCNRFGAVAAHKETTITLPMTHQLLATSLNLSRESVSREMEKLMRRGLVRYNKERQIVVPNPKELAEQLRVPQNPGLPSNVQL